MKKVLVPYDGSESAGRALEYALAQAPDGVHVLNVQPWPVVYGEYVTADVVDLIREGQMQTGRTLVEHAARLAAAAKVPCQTHVLMGNVELSVVEQVEQLGCDHIVMGTRGFGSLKGWMVGSVATKVLHLAKTPVTLLK